MKKYLLRSAALCFLAMPVALSACTGTMSEFTEVTAERIARPAFMVERKFDEAGMTLQLWERMHQRGEPANIYIEGDGISNTMFGKDPSPENPLALHLASRDHATNLGYIGRPCQFRETQDEEACSSKFWTTRRYSPEVFAVYNAALDDMKARYSITEFNLIGYDGGANIAAILSTQRSDVASLRTVGGNLSPDMVYDPVTSPLDPDNLKAIAYAPSMAKVPQHHFIGAGDAVTPPAVYHYFIQSMGTTDCVHYSLVPDADHTRGWVEKWPELLKGTTACVSPIVEVTTPLPKVPVDLKDESHGQK